MPFTKQLLHRLAGVDIVKVFSFNALSTLLRMLAGMVSVKVVATIIGPAGIALLGQLNNFNTILLGVANGGIGSGVTKYVAEYRDDESAIKKYFSNALRITLVCSLFVAVVLIFGCRQLSQLILRSDEYGYVFVFFGFTISLYTLNGLLIAIVNGYKQFKKYVAINVSGTIVGLLYSVTLVFFFGLSGALINAVTFQSIVFFITLWMCRKMPWMKKEYFKEKFDRLVTKRYLGYSLMTIVSLSLLPVSQMLLRGYVISELSMSEAGIWEGMNRISSMYLSVITTAFSVYYLPRLSELSDPNDLHREVMKCYKVIIPMLLCAGTAIYFLRYFILWLLFTPSFYPMSNLFGWQLAGDFFKICSWLLSFVMVAKARTKMFIITEIAFTLLYVSFCFFFLRMNGVVGLTQGYLCNYILYMVTMVIIFRSILFVRKS